MEERLLSDEELLAIIKKNSGGGGGTSDYTQLRNLPQINSVELTGNKSLSDLGIASEASLSAILDDIADEFDATATYAVDDIVIKDGVLYKCTTAHTGAWDVNDFTATTISDEVANVADAVDDIKNGTDIDSFGDVETALAGKQDTLTFDDVPTANSNNPVKSGGVKSAIDAAVSSAYHHAGTKTCVELVAGLLVAANEGNVYNMTDSGTTTADFIEGAGQPIKAGDNVGIAKISDGVYKFDLLSGFVDTSNFVQKSVTAGLLKNDGTVNDEIEGDVATLKSGFTNLDNEVNGDAVTYPYADVITIDDAVPANLADCSVKVEPVQDLHGYDKPWVGGAGKNKLPLVLADIKAFNTTGAWSGNVYTAGGGTIEILTDSDENITGFNVNGTFTSTVSFTLWAKALAPYPFSNTQYIMNGCPSGGAQASVYKMDIIYRKNAIDNVLLLDVGSGSLATDFSVLDNNAVNVNVRIVVYAGTVSNKIFYPMLRLATETDSTFAPYTNVCPISGHTEAVVSRNSKNLCEKTIRGYIDATNNKISINNDGETAIFYALKGKTYTLSASAKDRRTIAHISSDNVVDNMPLIEYTTVPTGVYTWTATWEGWTAWYFLSDASSEAENTIQIEFGETATTYEPYLGQQYTLALGDTIYGGTVDFDTGVMTASYVEHVYDGSSDENWSGETTGQGYANFYIAASDALKPQSELNSMAISNIAPLAPSPSASLNCFHVSVTGNLNVCIGDAIGVSTVADFKTWLSSNHLQVVYELATPLTVQLTPEQIQLLQGTNTLYASTGDISVTVNGVSGAIGQVQEQVNELAEDVADVTADVAEIGTTVHTAGVQTSGCVVKYVQIGKLVIVMANIVKGSAGWNVAHDLPRPLVSGYVGYTVDNYLPKYPLYMNDDNGNGRLQVRTGDTIESTDPVYFSYVAF